MEMKRFIQLSQEQGGNQKITIGKGQESHLVVDDSAWENIQFEIFFTELRYFLRAYKCQYLSLFKLPPHKCIIVTTKDFILLSNSEGFIITQCCGINNINEKLKRGILEPNSHIIHPKINEPLEVKENSTDPQIRLRFLKGQLMGRVYKFNINDKIAFGREEIPDHQNIIFTSNLISVHHLIMFFDQEYECWMIKEASEKGSLNCSYIALTSNSTANRINREQEVNISPDFYLAMGTQSDFITASTSLSVIYIYIYIGKTLFK